MASGAGIFYDGTSSERHQVTVDAAPDALRIQGADGTLLAQWPYNELQHLSAADDVLRLSRINSPTLARLEVRDPALALAIDDLAGTVDRTGRTARRARHKVIGWAFATTVSLVLVALFGLPALVERLTPLIPLSLEQRLGAAVEPQVRAMLNTGSSGTAFECGTAEAEKAGRAALDKLLSLMEGAASLPIPLKTVVVRRRDSNAIALPGGYVYVFNGLVTKAETPDELASVIAHEIGHVAHRDGTRSLLQAAGLSFLFGMLLGDFTGGGLAVIAVKTIVESSYSRDVEASADLYAVRLMARIGGDPRALGAILERIQGAIEPGVKIFLDHPETKARVAAINAATDVLQFERKPLLDAAEWRALRRVCG